MRLMRKISLLTVSSNSLIPNKFYFQLFNSNTSKGVSRPMCLCVETTILLLKSSN
jgi:hypothetical protein